MQSLEDRARLLEDWIGIGRPGEAHQAAALPEEREALLLDDPESTPAVCGIGVRVGSCLQVAARFGKGGVRRDQGMPRVRPGTLGSGDELLGERVVAKLKRGADHRGEGH